MTPELGIIEARFGRPWSWAERAAVISLLGPAGYGFYHYGPKADARLRRAWRTAHEPGEMGRIAELAAQCRSRDMRFGIALTPIDAHLDFDAATRAALVAKLAAFDAIGADDLIILFDDLRGDMPDLAERQADVMKFCADHSRATRFYLCPSYYSDDPVLDRVFGRRPDRYIETLGRELDSGVSVYWTGAEVCAREIRPGSLAAINARLGRAVCLWDNYPVNDGPRMSRFLHLRAFTGRSASIAGHVSGHAVNPAMQPILGCIPALTLPMSYQAGEDYDYAAAFAEAARIVVGDQLAELLQEDLMMLNDAGLERLAEAQRRLRERYAAIDHPAAQEVVEWLDGGYSVSEEEVRTQ
ncbi:hyaluronidase [Sphingomonas oleivorans]|uniref:Hyaluronidase n=1 Tax=Sphingomonas oleivorans TaxID=1735121 RepID=A0A2T5FUS9_9SPHN|nr:beta-N-acetylglucosaminidase domain-containing protein [Sphingomonas oleivorans]PTQ08284.1 hyaluronidase [Sphingomonas oleivorans]